MEEESTVELTSPLFCLGQVSSKTYAVSGGGGDEKFGLKNNISFFNVPYVPVKVFKQKQTSGIIHSFVVDVERKLIYVGDHNKLIIFGFFTESDEISVKFTEDKIVDLDCYDYEHIISINFCDKSKNTLLIGTQIGVLYLCSMHPEDTQIMASTSIMPIRDIKVQQDVFTYAFVLATSGDLFIYNIAGLSLYARVVLLPETSPYFDTVCPLISDGKLLLVASFHQKNICAASECNLVRIKIFNSIYKLDSNYCKIKEKFTAMTSYYYQNRKLLIAGGLSGSIFVCDSLSFETFKVYRNVHSLGISSLRVYEIHSKSCSGITNDEFYIVSASPDTKVRLTPLNFGFFYFNRTRIIIFILNIIAFAGAYFILRAF